VGGRNLLLPPLSVHTRPLQGFGLGSPTRGYAGLHEPPTHGPTVDAEADGNLLFGDALAVQPDDTFNRDVQQLTRFEHFGPAAELDVFLLQPGTDGVTLNPEFAGQLLGRFPGKVAADEVVDVRRFHYDGPVYDVTTEHGHFTVSQSGLASIVTRNCRCVPTPVDVETWKELKAGGARIARGYEQFMPKPPAKAAPKPKPKKPVQTLPLNLQPLANAADPAVTEKDIDAAIRHMRTLPREELKKVAKALGVDPSQGGITMRDQIIDKVEATREAVRETKAQAVIARLPIPVKADPNTSARFRLEAAEAVETVPAHVLAEAGQTGKSVHMGKKVTEVVPHLKGVTPRGWAPGSTWDEADGLYNNSVGEVIVTEETTHGKSHRTAGVVRHELGHAVDEAWGETKGEPSGLYCNSPEFQAAYEADMKEAAAGPDAPSLAYYLQPGAAGRSEAFAETFASVHGGGGSSPKTIASNFPRVKALIEAEIESRRPK
jgi:hypothetical protein